MYKLNSVYMNWQSAVVSGFKSSYLFSVSDFILFAAQVLAYSCVYSYYNQDTEKMDVMEQQTEALDLHTNALQILLG